jgi:ribosomal protein L11 methyltransferase
MLREIKFLCLERSAEDFGDLMIDAGAMSVSIEDADLGSPDEKPLYGEPGTEPDTFAWTRSIVSVLADEKFDALQAAAIAAKALGIETPAMQSDTVVPDEDWVRITQAQFSPVKVSDRLWIVPSWHEPPSSDAINIRLDPGVAFGTGSHPTTHLCLQWLDTHVTGEDSVLDYGCGTGILAIAAAKLGAASVLGTDIDPQAVESAAYNARHNEVEARFVLPAELPSERFSLVVANILSNPLKVLAPALLGRVAPGGRLVLSGVLARQAEEVIEVYRRTDPNVELSVWREEDGWVCIAGTRK